MWFSAGFFFKPSSVRKCRALHKRKKRPGATYFSDKYTQIAGGIWALHQGSTSPVGWTGADSSDGPSHLSLPVEVGWREGGSMSALSWLEWVRALSHHYRKLCPGSGVCIHLPEGRRETRRSVFNPLVASNQGWAISESTRGWAASLTVGTGRFPLCIVAGFYTSLFHFQCSPEELIREKTMFLPLVALNNPQNANKRQSCSCVKYSCCYVVRDKGTNIRAWSF